MGCRVLGLGGLQGVGFRVQSLRFGVLGFQGQVF